MRQRGRTAGCLILRPSNWKKLRETAKNLRRVSNLAAACFRNIDHLQPLTGGFFSDLNFKLLEAAIRRASSLLSSLAAERLARHH
jgi:hypothetical protein